MKYIMMLFLVLLVSCQLGREPKNKAASLDFNAEIGWLYDWLSAWELIAQDEFRLDKTNPPEMVFFDNQFVYTNSRTSAPTGKKIKGPSLYARRVEWFKAEHNDTLTLPDGNRVPVQIMTFAGPSDKENTESFFVMAAPSFWQNAGIDSKEVGLDNMLTGVFLHEFAHTRQMNGIGKMISYYENNYEFDFPVSDDIIQDYFSSDPVYVQLFKDQTEALYDYSLYQEKDKIVVNGLIQNFEKRQQTHIIPKKKILVQIERIFLTMEGIGQYAMFTWLSHSQGGGFSEELAMKATRRGKNWWSQDEGLAWMLLYKKISEEPNWKIMFSENARDIFELIKKEVKVSDNND